MSKRAVVTGVLGQDGSYLAEHLISQGYDVYGIYRRISSGNNFDNIAQIRNHPRMHLVEGDICDSAFINNLVQDLQPDEYYGLAAQSHVGYSFKNPLETFRCNADAVLFQLEAIRQFSPKTKFYNASTSEMMGGLNCPATGYDENSPFNPRSPYAVAKLAAYHATKNYRESYGLFAVSGILFNHSSVRRGGDFATAKIARGVASIVLGQTDKLHMGNLEAFRDEGHSKDYVRGQHLILQQSQPEDFVISMGAGATIREMLEYVCSLAGKNLDDVYVQDPRFMRPSEVPFLLGDSTKIRSIGWEPSYTWKTILEEMYQDALARGGK